MICINSKSDKRLIIEGVINGKTANFLIDTGASLALIDKNQRKEYNLKSSRDYPGTIIGAGGELRNLKVCDNIVNIKHKTIAQFIMADIESIVESIKRETDIDILGIISLPQMKFAGIQIDTNDSMIMLE